MNFGKRLKQLRIEHGLTQQDLAQKINLSKPNVSKYEAGLIEPNFETLSLMASMFDVSVDYLLGKTNIPSASLDEQLSEVDFALYGEVKDLTDEEKRKIIEFIKFTKSQRG